MLHKTRVAIRFRAKKTLNSDYPKFCVGMPAVRTDERAVYGHVIAKFSRMGFTTFTYPWCNAARSARESSPKNGVKIFRSFNLIVLLCKEFGANGM